MYPLCLRLFFSVLICRRRRQPLFAPVSRCIFSFPVFFAVVVVVVWSIGVSPFSSRAPDAVCTSVCVSPHEKSLTEAIGLLPTHLSRLSPALRCRPLSYGRAVGVLPPFSGGEEEDVVGPKGKRTPALRRQESIVTEKCVSSTKSGERSTAPIPLCFLVVVLSFPLRQQNSKTRGASVYAAPSPSPCLSSYPSLPMSNEPGKQNEAPKEKSEKKRLQFSLLQCETAR